MSFDDASDGFENFLRRKTEEDARMSALRAPNLEYRAHALLHMAYEYATDALKMDEAIASAGAAADIWLELERPFEYVRAIWHAGDCLLETNRFEDAIEAYQGALEHGDEITMTSAMSSVNFQISKCYTRLDREYEAELAAVKAAELSLEANLSERAPRAYMLASSFARIQKRWNEAADYCEKAIELLKDETSPDDLAEAYARRAENLTDLKRFEESGACLDRASNLMTLTNMDWLQAGMAFQRAKLWTQTGMAAEALPLFEEAHQGALEKKAGGFAAEVLFWRARAHLLIGEIEQARAEFESLKSITEDGQSELDLAEIESLICQCNSQPGLFEVQVDVSTSRSRPHINDF